MREIKVKKGNISRLAFKSKTGDLSFLQAAPAIHLGSLFPGVHFFTFSELTLHRCCTFMERENLRRGIGLTIRH